MLYTLCEKGIKLDFILLCETFLRDANAHYYTLNGYSLVIRNRGNSNGGGVCIYIRDNIQFKLRDDIAIFNEGEFKSIVIETTDNSVIIGEIYRVPNTNTSVQLLLERYEQIMSKILTFWKIGTHVHIEEFLNTYLSSSLLPTINKPTIITHTSATIIDNLYVKYNHNLDMHSGIIISDMSDHLPIFCFLSYKKQKSKTGKAATFESRPITADGISAMINKLQHIDWNCLEHSTTDDAYNTFIQQLNNIMDVCIPKKKVVIPSRFVIRNPWMTKGLVTSSRTSTKLYHKCMKKTRTDPLHIKYINFRNCYNKLTKHMENYPKSNWNYK